MSPSTADLEARQGALLARCAREREALKLQSGRIAAAAGSCDAGLATMRRWLQGPVLLGAAIALAWGLRRTAAAKNISGTLGLLGIAMRLRSLADLADEPARGGGA